MSINKEAIISFIKERSVEPSTWRGAIMIITSCAGLTIDPALTEQIILFGIGLAGIVGTLSKDKK